MAALADATGTVHAPCQGEARIVSLVPSITELLFALGLGEQVVGRTRFCIHPRPAIEAVPKVGGTKDVRLDKVRALAPTHCIVNIDENRREDAEALAEIAQLVVTHPLAPADNRGLFRLLGGIFEREAEAEALCRRLDEAWARLERQVRREPLRVLYLIWRRPWMCVGPETYIARMLALAGWRTVPAAPAARYPEIAPGDPCLADCDLVLASSEPFPFKAKHIAEFRADTGLDAVRVELVDGELLSWYGSRAIAGLDYLADLATRVAAR